MKRSVVRFERDQLDALGKLAARCTAETGKPARRAALVRLLVDVKLAEIDERPIAAQLPLAELGVERMPSMRSTIRVRTEPGSTIRDRILTAMAEHPTEVFTPARLAPLVRVISRDTVRNTLLVLYARGRIEKLGPGQYRAWPSPPCCSATCAPPELPGRCRG